MRVLRNVILTGVLSFGLISLEATVYREVGQAWNGWISVDGLPWEQAYESEMIVNGRRQILHLYSTRYSEPVYQQLAKRLSAMGAAFEFSENNEGFSGIAKMGECEVRILVSSPPSEPRHFIFFTYPDPGPKRGVKLPVQQYPNSKILSTVDNMRTKTSYATLTTSAQPVVVYEFYDQLLTSGGWKALLPDTGLKEKGGELRIYQRKDKVCHIQVRQSAGISSIITLLVKNGTK